MEAVDIKGGFWHGGYYHIIRNSDDLVRFFREFVNLEAAQLVEELAAKAHYAAAALDTDLHSYESELSELHGAIRDFERTPERLEELARKGRLTKSDQTDLCGIASKIRGLLGFT